MVPSVVYVAVDWPSYESIAAAYAGSLWETASAEDMRKRDSCYKWWRLYLPSFRKYFPGAPLLVGGRDPADPRILDLFRKYDAECIQVPGTQHGEGLDALAQTLAKRQVDIMIHTEPDCLFNGREWVRALLKPILSGEVDMTGDWFETSYLHITASAWRVAAIPPCGFRRQVRRREQWLEPRIEQVVSKISRDMLHLLRNRAAVPDEILNATIADLWVNWDTGGAAWFDLAAKGRAKYVPREADFVHLWVGRETTPEDRREAYRNVPWVSAYLNAE